MIDLSAERGNENVTVRGLTRLAGVSTRSFYKHFSNAEECFADTYEAVMQDGLQAAYAAQLGVEDDEEALRASLRALLEGLAEDPKAARLVLVEAFALGLGMQTRMRDATAGFERLLTDSFPAALAPPREVVGGIAAGVMRVARTRLLSGDGAEPSRLAEQLGDWTICFPAAEAPPLEPRDGKGFFALSARRENGEPCGDPLTPVLGQIGDEQGRILSAVTKLAAAGGFANLTIPRVRAEAGVSRRSFDRRFANLSECFLAAIEAMVASAVSRAHAEADASEGWAAGIHRGISALCAEAARSPVFARLAFVEIFAPGREGLARRERLITLGTERLRTAIPDGGPSELVAEASVAAVWRIAHAEIAAGRVRELIRLAPLLTYVILAPVIGAAEASEAIRAVELSPLY